MTIDLIRDALKDMPTLLDIPLCDKPDSELYREAMQRLGHWVDKHWHILIYAQDYYETNSPQNTHNIHTDNT